MKQEQAEPGREAVQEMARDSTRTAWTQHKPLKSILPTFIHTRLLKQKSSLLQLPVDALFSIFDALPLSAKILLSQTCRALWYTLLPRCRLAIEKASLAERLDGLEGLLPFLPNYDLCYPCQALHTRTRNDTLVRSPYKTRFTTRICPALDVTSRGHPVGGQPAVTHRQVEMAVKYAELPVTEQTHRSKLFPGLNFSISDYCGLEIRFFARGRVDEGQFSMSSTWEFRTAAQPQPLSFDLFRETPFRICPHLDFSSPDEGPANVLSTSLSNAFDELEGSFGAFHLGVPGSCSKRSTDFTLYALGVGRLLVLKVHHHLGTGRDPGDPIWTEHFCKENNVDCRSSRSESEHRGKRRSWRPRLRP